MYDYDRRRKIGPLTILFLFLFTGSLVGLSIISYLDKGKFWDVLPFFLHSYYNHQPYTGNI